MIRGEARRDVAFHVDGDRHRRVPEFGFGRPRQDRGESTPATAPRLTRSPAAHRQTPRVRRDALRRAIEPFAVRTDPGPDDDIAAAQRRIEAAAQSKTDRPADNGVVARRASGAASRHCRRSIAHPAREDRRFAFESADEEEAGTGAELGHSVLHAEHRSAAIAALQIAIAGQRPKREELGIAMIPQIEDARESRRGMEWLVPEAVLCPGSRSDRRCRVRPLDDRLSPAAISPRAPTRSARRCSVTAENR